MTPVEFAPEDGPLSVLCLGAHSDDIEIGVGGTVLTLISRYPVNIHWCVLSAGDDRETEARSSAADFLFAAKRAEVEVLRFRDGYFPEQGETVKSWFESLKARVNPSVIFTHAREDAHQDHREVCRHTWSTFRDSVILEYEVPKWDGDLGRPNFYVPISCDVLGRKVDLLMRHFRTQRSKQWFDKKTFCGLARIRGVECRAPEGNAEAFFARKLRLT